MQPIALALLAVSVLLLLRLGPAAIAAWRIYAGTGKRRQVDATDQAPAASPSVADRSALLADLGYAPIGVTSLTLPVGERFAWILAAADGESYAIVTAGNVRAELTGLYSAWPDGMWLGTLHPMGGTTDRPTLQVRVVSTTLADAVGEHRAGIDRLRASHGAPRPVRSMAEMLALDLDYRQRFGGSRLLPLTLRIVLPALLALALAILSAVLLVTGIRR